ncbi:MAG: hypothetical protein HKN01_01405 [Acidimicrobiia bacterium]|nr:hypothetical protein [Acidimicrobiia bacterium]
MKATGDLPEAFAWANSVAGETTLEGRVDQVCDEPIEMEDRFNEGVRQSVVYVVIEDPTGDLYTLWMTEKKDVDKNPRPDRKYQAVAAALKDAGVSQILEGGTLKIQHSSDNDTGKGNAEKIFKAKYTPPATGMAMESEEDAF